MKYDVIIVGGGSAGCALAARLSEDPTRSVLLIEAGPDYPDFERLPDELKYGYSKDPAAVDAPHNWSFVGAATPHQTEPMPVPRGRVMGGSSAINGQAFLRGLPEDYDNWASWGNDEWSYLKVLPYFRKLETDLTTKDDFHGSDGPIPVRSPRREEWLPFTEAFHRACIAAGFPEHPDMNNPDSTGVSPKIENTVDGVRMSTALTYIDPVRHRINLTIRDKVLATRVVFDGNRATGIELESGGERFTVEGEEIILSAGAVASPHLLMLSGVGPASHLDRFGIPVLRDLPGVGQNMRDHPCVVVRLEAKEGYAVDPEGPRLQTFLRYTAEGSSYRNDMLITAACHSGDVRRRMDAPQQTGVALICCLYLAMGAGELRLASADPHVQPDMDYRYLENPWDRQRMRDAVRLCSRLLDHQALGDMVAGPITPTLEETASDDALDTWLLKNVRTSYHVSATCKMGPESETMAVVDQYCRVHGTEGLRVIDASVMPDCIRANTNATAIMIAERAADFIG